MTLVRACVTKSSSVSIHVKGLEAHVALRAFRRCDSEDFSLPSGAQSGAAEWQTGALQFFEEVQQ